MAGSLDGLPPEVQRAPQPMHEECPDSSSPDARTHEDARNRPRVSKSYPDRLCSIRRIVWKRALVGPERDWQTRGSSTPAHLAS